MKADLLCGRRRFSAACPTNLGVPLQDTSCHPAHIHKSWPVSMVRRLGDLSTSHSYAEKAKNILIERFVKHLASPNLINRLRATSTSQTKTPTRASHRNGDRMWVTFPFHPVWSKHMTKAVMLGRVHEGCCERHSAKRSSTSLSSAFSTPGLPSETEGRHFPCACAWAICHTKSGASSLHQFQRSSRQTDNAFTLRALGLSLLCLVWRGPGRPRPHRQPACGCGSPSLLKTPRMVMSMHAGLL